MTTRETENDDNNDGTLSVCPPYLSLTLRRTEARLLCLFYIPQRVSDELFRASTDASR